MGNNSSKRNNTHSNKYNKEITSNVLQNQNEINPDQQINKLDSVNFEKNLKKDDQIQKTWNFIESFINENHNFFVSNSFTQKNDILNLNMGINKDFKSSIHNNIGFLSPILSKEPQINEYFRTPSPVKKKSKFKTVLNEIPIKKNEKKSYKSQITQKNPKNEDKITNNSKYKANYFRFSNNGAGLKENLKINEIPITRLDLPRSSSYSNNKKSSKKIENIDQTEHQEINFYKKKKNDKKIINKLNKKEAESFYSKENLGKYLNKSHSDFSNNNKYLQNKYQKKNVNGADERINFLYMKYHLKKARNQSNTHEQKNLENNISYLKNSLNNFNFKEKIHNYEDEVWIKNNELDRKISEVEKLRNSLLNRK